MDFVKYIWKSANLLRSKESIQVRPMSLECDPENARCAFDVSAKHDEVDRINIFSVELLLHIFSFMNVTTLGTCSRVCSLWNDLTQDHTIWRALCVTDSYVPLSLPRIPDWSKSWKEVYKFHYECKINVFT